MEIFTKSDLEVDQTKTCSQELSTVDLKDEQAFHACYFCKKSCDSKIMLNHHMFIKHKKKIKTCKYCQISFINLKLLSMHFNKHITRKNNVLKCSLCPRAFFNKTNLVNHENKHGLDRADSGFCLEIEYVQSVILPSHQDEYFGFENTFTCELCSKSFKRKSSLELHRLTHEKKREKYSCKDSIETSKVCNGEKPSVLNLFQCKYCGFLFENKNKFKNHVDCHIRRENLKKYICKYCQKRFLHPTMLFRHFRKGHKNEYPFKCLPCELSFDKQQAFSQHVKYEHKKFGRIRFDEDNLIVYDETLHRKIVPKLDTQDVDQQKCSNLNSDNLESFNINIDNLDCNKNETLKEFKENENKASDISKSICNDSNQTVPNSDNLLTDTPQTHNINCKKNKNNNSVECVVCGLTLKRRSLKNHSLIHKKINKFRCHLCPLSFRSKIKLNFHTKEHFKNDDKLCICGVKCKSVTEIEIHKRNCTSINIAKPIYKSKISKITNGDKNSEIDPLNDDCIVVVDPAESAFIVLKANYVKSIPIPSTSESSNTAKIISTDDKMRTENNEPKNLFLNCIKAPSTKVIIKRITQEEAALKRKTAIKGTPIIDDKDKIEDPVTNDNFDSFSPHRSKPSETIEYKNVSNNQVKRFDYASVIKKSVKD